MLASTKITGTPAGMPPEIRSLRRLAFIKNPDRGGKPPRDSSPALISSQYVSAREDTVWDAVFVIRWESSPHRGITIDE